MPWLSELVRKISARYDAIAIEHPGPWVPSRILLGLAFGFLATLAEAGSAFFATAALALTIDGLIILQRQRRLGTTASTRKPRRHQAEDGVSTSVTADTPVHHASDTHHGASGSWDSPGDGGGDGGGGGGGD